MTQLVEFDHPVEEFASLSSERGEQGILIEFGVGDFRRPFAPVLPAGIEVEEIHFPEARKMLEEPEIDRWHRTCAEDADPFRDPSARGIQLKELLEIELPPFRAVFPQCEVEFSLPRMAFRAPFSRGPLEQFLLPVDLVLVEETGDFGGELKEFVGISGEIAGEFRDAVGLIFEQGGEPPRHHLLREEFAVAPERRRRRRVETLQHGAADEVLQIGKVEIGGDAAVCGEELGQPVSHAPGLDDDGFRRKGICRSMAEHRVEIELRQLFKLVAGVEMETHRAASPPAKKRRNASRLVSNE